MESIGIFNADKLHTFFNVQIFIRKNRPNNAGDANSRITPQLTAKSFHSKPMSSPITRIGA